MDMDLNAFMPLITEASQSKNYAYEALACAKKQDQAGFTENITQSRNFLMRAHNKQTELLNLNAREEETPVTVFVIHAMDHVSNAQLMYDLIKELAEIHLNQNGEGASKGH